MLLAGLMVLTPLAPIPSMADTPSARARAAPIPHHNAVPQQNNTDFSSTSAAGGQETCGDHQNCDGQCCAACAHRPSAVAVWVGALASRERGRIMWSHIAIPLFSFTPYLLERPPRSHA